MESPSSDFSQGHPQTPHHHLYLLQPYSFLCSFANPSLNTISVSLQSQSSPTRLCFSFGPSPDSRGTFQLLSTPPQVLRVPF